LKPEEAAQALGISPRKLWSITADRDSGIPCVRFGRSVLYPVAELAAWLRKRVEEGGR
jgi:predicted DNA-binding transcriptional regulator AlpA